MNKQPIGGFFPLALTSELQIDNNMLSFWGVNERNSLCLHNARSCLHHLLIANNVKRLWLPAYVCESLVAAVHNTHTGLLYYPLTANLSPRTDFLDDYCQPGDYVLAIDYFGKYPDHEFLAFVNEHKDMVFLEDRAQALKPGSTAWGDWILYSPRKVLGVTDGGILIANHAFLTLPNVTIEPITKPDFIAPALLRFEDQAESHNQIWYEYYQACEQRMLVSNKAMSQLTHALLAMIDPIELCRQRQNNYRLLAQEFAEIKFFNGKDPDFVPFGFPIRLTSADHADKIWQALCEQRIFAQRHWLNLPSPADQFPVEHQLSRELITLPCDHRYSAEDMEQVIKILKSLLK